VALASIFRMRGRREREAAEALYGAVVAQARSPVFFTALGVPDTIDGRFEMLSLHAFLVLHRLKAEPVAAGLAQALFDLFFADMDRSLREMGASDLGVGRRVKAMATGFYGRIRAYEQGLKDGPDALIAALRRNVYGTVAAAPQGAVAAMSNYLRRQQAALAEHPAEVLRGGRLTFAPFAAGDLGRVAP